MSKSNGDIKGTIFKTDSVGNNYADVYVFNDTIDGVEPYGSLILATDGNLYGMTNQGGNHNLGTIFQFNPITNIYTKKYDFDGINGEYPFGSLAQTSNGKLYGMTYGGGEGTFVKPGVLFEYDISTEVFTKKVDFITASLRHGYGSLIEGSDGMLYGLTSMGGWDGTGALFQYDPDTEIIIRKYGFIIGVDDAGYNPRGSLVQDTDGQLYGFSQYGKPGFELGGGVLFKFDLSVFPWDGFTSLHQFDKELPSSLNGYELMGSLIQAGNGRFYGMTILGGEDSAGTIFEYDMASDTINKLYDFNSGTDGFQPHGSLLQASNGKLYGLTTSEGGQAKMFQFDIQNNVFTITTNITGTPYYTSLIEINSVSTKSIEQENDCIINIFPNPVGNDLHIEFQNDLIIDNMSITDITGMVIFTKSENFETINTLDFAAGIYILNVKTEKKRWCHKFVKQ